MALQGPSFAAGGRVKAEKNQFQKCKGGPTLTAASIGKGLKHRKEREKAEKGREL